MGKYHWENPNRYYHLLHLLIQPSAQSHTRTVVRECCKGDDASQWENGKFDPLPRPNPLTDRRCGADLCAEERRAKYKKLS